MNLIIRINKKYSCAHDMDSKNSKVLDNCWICLENCAKKKYICKCDNYVINIHQKCYLDWVIISGNNLCSLCKTNYQFSIIDIILYYYYYLFLHIFNVIKLKYIINNFLELFHKFSEYNLENRLLL